MGGQTEDDALQTSKRRTSEGTGIQKNRFIDKTEAVWSPLQILRSLVQTSHLAILIGTKSCKEATAWYYVNGQNTISQNLRN